MHDLAKNEAVKHSAVKVETAIDNRASDDYARHYSDASFWDKLGRFARQAGRDVVEKALVLYYVGNDAATPAWAKGVIAAALGYYIFPLDLIPDLSPFVGYADDLGAIAAATAAIAACITADHRAKAAAKAAQWFG